MSRSDRGVDRQTPLYFNTESYYENVGFGTADHELLRNVISGISGKFMVSYNDCPEIRSLYDGGSMFGNIRTLNIEGEPWFVGKALIDHVDVEDKLNNVSLSSLG